MTKTKSVSNSVIDSDGEFLLIEAADHLPKWIKSNNSDQRVSSLAYGINKLPNETYYKLIHFRCTCVKIQ